MAGYIQCEHGKEQKECHLCHVVKWLDDTLEELEEAELEEITDEDIIERF